MWSASGLQPVAETLTPDTLLGLDSWYPHPVYISREASIIWGEGGMGSTSKDRQERPQRELAAGQPQDSGYKNMARFIFRPL